METVDSLASQVFASMKAYCDGEVERRIETLRESFEQRLAEVPAGKDGENGKDGSDGVAGKDAEVDYTKIYSAMSDLLKEQSETFKGPVGEQGEKGTDGAAGNDGQDADMDAIAKQITELVGEAVAAIPIPKDGKDGEKGADGKDGESVKGEAGEKGIDGLNGADGQNGQDGRDGKDGEPGRDAMEPEILPELDLTRSYPRGTFARHLGGLWVSRATAPGLESWDCVMVGIAGFKAFVHPEDERTVSLQVAYSDGGETVHALAFPVQINRGVWAAGAYERGDVVTRHGSQWHAMRVTEAEPGLPSSEEDWKLVVKRGERGKDADGAAPRSVEQRVVRLK